MATSFLPLLRTSVSQFYGLATPCLWIMCPRIQARVSRKRSQQLERDGTIYHPMLLLCRL